MGSIDGFLSHLRNYEKENIHPEVVKAIQPYINAKGILTHNLTLLISNRIKKMTTILDISYELNVYD